MSSLQNNLYNTNHLQVNPSQVVVVYTQWNEEIVNELIAGAKRIFDTFEDKIQITFIQVPGCIEIPFAIKNHYRQTKNTNTQANAYIAFGTVIRGDTAHFDYVCQSVTQGITLLNIELEIPTIFGILTVENQQQAIERIGGTHGHKGEEAAIAALNMMQLCFKN